MIILLKIFVNSINFQLTMTTDQPEDTDSV